MDKETQQRFVEAVEGDNKERDFSIMKYHALSPEATYSEIVNNLALDISEDRVCQILKTNQLLVLKLFAQINPMWFKEGRMMVLTKMFNRKTKGGIYSGKDPIDIVDSMRKEVEGDNKTSVGIIINNKEKDGEVSLKSSDIEFQNRIQSEIEERGIL